MSRPEEPKVTRLRTFSSTQKRRPSKKNSLISLSTKSKNNSISFQFNTPKAPSTSKNPSSKRKIEIFFPDNNNSFNSSLSSTNKSLNSSRKISRASFSRDDSMQVKPSPRTLKLRKKIDPDEVLKQSKLPLPPQEALKQFGNFMNKYEQEEILEFEQIYYIGFKSSKTKPDINANNYGYDDERSDYKLVVGDHVAYRFEIKQILGKGSFGQVCKCLDHKTNQEVALKIIRNEKRFHRQGKVEIKILHHIKYHDKEDAHCVHMQNYFVFRSHICLTFELLSINLYELLRSNGSNGFSLSLVRRFAIQLLASLAFLSEHKIIHCDLKPENILLKNPTKSGIKIIDFGSSCFEHEKLYTYIQSRFYRAPEIILGLPYSMAIDMWSLGCILSELHSGYPLFAGETEHEQLLCIMEIKGIPPVALLKKATKTELFFDSELNPKIIANSRGKKRYPGTRSLQEKSMSSDKKFLNFIERCIDWNPDTRMTPQEAAFHPWIQEGFEGLRTLRSSTGSRGDGY
ncbi:DYRK4_1 [Blepharisma stoltei]|uniref:dual-specificity kinase n=1 Tax=Blepharisma stoltei TaxID=1481888 RepID=A0AAU9K7F0_9CILI|nr:unnamed protein product [Blepharisma stoltei]